MSRVISWLQGEGSRGLGGLVGKNPFWLGAPTHLSPRYLIQTSPAASNVLKHFPRSLPTCIPNHPKSCQDGERANANQTSAGGVWPGVEASSWCVVWVASVTAGMDEDTQRELLLGQKGSNKELGAHAREISPVVGKKMCAGS